MEPEAQIFSERAEPFVESATLHESFDAKKAATPSEPPLSEAGGAAAGRPPPILRRVFCRKVSPFRFFGFGAT